MATAIKTVGTVFSVISAIKGGNEQKRIANSNASEIRRVGEYNANLSLVEAAQLDKKALQERAITSRQIGEDKRKARLLISRSMAVAGKSGGGVLQDVSVINDISKIAEVGEYNAAVSLWSGNNAALAFEDSAFMKRKDADIGLYESRLRASESAMQGDYAKKSSRIGAVSTLLNSGSSIYSRYKSNKAAGKGWWV